MNSFELNKIMGAILGTLLFVVGLNVVTGLVYAPRRPVVAGYDLPAPAAEEASSGGDQQAQAEPLPVLLASASTEKGQAQAKKCQACHSLEKGGPNKIGPNLWGVLERAKGSHEGFAYSSAMKGKGGNWTFEDLDHFIANPKGYVSGTIMAFAGISSPKDRADVIKYLDTLADSPVPLPKAEPAAAKEAPPAKDAPAAPAKDAPGAAPAPAAPPAKAPTK